MIELKHCPFCGGEAFIDCFKTSEMFMPTVYVPKCRKCKAEINVPFRTELAAAVAWDRRENDGV